MHPKPEEAGELSGSKGQMRFTHSREGVLVIRLAGDWRMRDGLPTIAELEQQLESAPSVRQVGFDTRELGSWDSGLLAFLAGVVSLSTRRGIETDWTGLPNSITLLLKLATAVPAKTGDKHEEQPSLLARIGLQTTAFVRGVPELLAFIGNATLAFANLLRGKARVRRSDLAVIIQATGPEALPIVSLISLLVGLIMAFVGAVQLRQFGAQIYVADMVGLAMTREMGAMMVAFVIAGRTGAAFAAQLGTMQVNEEIDALRTLAISPMEFMVLPRMLALMLVMPLLTLYANLMGIVGGTMVGVGMLDLALAEYVQQTRWAVGLPDFAIGLSKSIVFGILVAIAGCLRGMQCGRSSAAVGIATTSAVVTAIVMIVVADAIMTVMFYVLGI